MEPGIYQWKGRKSVTFAFLSPAAAVSNHRNIDSLARVAGYKNQLFFSCQFIFEDEVEDGRELGGGFG